MWAKFKETLGGVLAVLLVPILAIVYYLQQRNRDLTGRLQDSKAEADMAEAITKQQEAKHAADTKVDDFDQLSAKYEREHPKG